MSFLDANPYKPGAGHSPPHLAGRSEEIAQFREFLKQETITKNVILTGLRGVGKTVLMDDKYKPVSIEAGWKWVGSDFSESSFLSEDNLAVRLITDLTVFSSSLSISKPTEKLGFARESTEEANLDFEFLVKLYHATPGLTVDRLKAVFELVWQVAATKGSKGIIFAYDEAQVVSDRSGKDQYPLACLLELFQSLQRKGAKCMLLLTGLPTLFPRLVESRTYAERMFSVQEIGRLSRDASLEAITVPLEGHSWTFTDDAVETIIRTADGYPYFIQFICRQVFDYIRANPDTNQIPIEPIVRQLDANFFAGRWDTLTDRQRDFLYCVALLENSDNEFAIGEIVEVSKDIENIKPFSYNDVSQMLPRVMDRGLVYKNRLGKYAFAVPLLNRFIKRRLLAKNRQQTLFDA